MESVAVNSGYNFFSVALDLLMKDGVKFTKGDEEMSKEDLMKMAWGDFSPDSELTVSPKKKKVAAPKKPRALSGYTYFGQQNKEKFNEEMEKMDEKPKFVSYVGIKWKELSKEEQEEWNVKAKEAFEASNQ